MIGFWIGWVVALVFNLFVSPFIVDTFAPYDVDNLGPRILGLILVDICVAVSFGVTGIIIEYFIKGDK